MTGIGTYWRTLRHLRPVQVLGRVRHQLWHPMPRRGPAPPRRQFVSGWVMPARRLPSLVGPRRFRFLNEERELPAHGGWDDPSVPRLWRYNLHYFDDLNAEAADRRRAWQHALVARWIAENPPGAGTAWEPYPVSMRIVNWIKWSLGGEALTPDQERSLAVQARWLLPRLEVHLLGNHLFANAKALVYAGLYFAGKEAEQWLAIGLGVIERELDEQILPDGGHFERTPLYHALALEDVLDLINLLDACGGSAGPRARALAGRLRQLVPAMHRWLLGLSHPDASLGLFNDTAEDIAPCTAELARYARDLGCTLSEAPFEGLVHFAPSGYARIAHGPAVALLDVAPIGPDYLPGHAHADTLSFELSVGGRRIVVNGGTSRYGTGSERLLERSTASHSTVQVDGRDSSEVWDGFRVGRRARPLDLEIDAAHGTSRVACSHDGYRFLPGRPIHRRTWTMTARGLTVADSVAPGYPAVARYLLAPQVSIEDADGRWSLTVDGRPTATVVVERGKARVEPARCACRFGVVLPTKCLSLDLQDGQAVTHWRWQSDAHPLSD